MPWATASVAMETFLLLRHMLKNQRVSKGGAMKGIYRGARRALQTRTCTEARQEELLYNQMSV